jgi:hypothetical protein
MINDNRSSIDRGCIWGVTIPRDYVREYVAKPIFTRLGDCLVRMMPGQWIL